MFRVSSGFQILENNKTTQPVALWFQTFLAFGNPMKHEARVFGITSPTKKISLDYHLNKFFQFNYHIWDVKYAWSSKMCMMCMILSPNCCAVTIFEYSTTEITLPSCSFPASDISFPLCDISFQLCDISFPLRDIYCFYFAIYRFCLKRNRSSLSSRHCEIHLHFPKDNLR